MLYPNLPDEFWVRPELAQIRQAARSRLVSPDATMAACLARVSALTHYRHQLPPLVARTGTLDLHMLIVSQPGIGKGGAMDTAADLIPGCDEDDGFRVCTRSFGSGEGMTAAWFKRVEELDDRGKTEKVKWVTKRYYNGVLFSCDEGSTYKALSERSGQTTPELIRQAFSGEKLGGTYVGASKDSQLARRQYRAAFVMAVQPVHAQKLLGEWEAGTPHRFAFMSAQDGEMPDEAPEWPGPLDWKPSRQDTEMNPEHQYGGNLISVTPSVGREIRARHRAKHRGEIDLGRYDSHRDLLTLKVAALLGSLHNRRLEVSLENWRLAGLFMATSDAVRGRVLGDIAVAEEEAEVISIGKSARRAAAVRSAEIATETDIDRVALVMARACRANPGQTSRELKKRTASRDRHLRDLALKRAESMGLIDQREGGTWWPVNAE